MSIAQRRRVKQGKIGASRAARRRDSLSAMAKTTSAGKDRETGIELREFAARRQRVLKALGSAAAVVFAGEGAPPLLGKWKPDYNFYYLTGLADEAGAALLFDPENPDPDRRTVLFLRPLNPELERWDGYRESIASGLKERTGFKTFCVQTGCPAFSPASRAARSASPASIRSAPTPPRFRATWRRFGRWPSACRESPSKTRLTCFPDSAQ